MERSGIAGWFAIFGEKLYLLSLRFLPEKRNRENLRRNLEILCPQEQRDKLLQKYYGGKIGFTAMILLAGGILSGCLWVKGIAAGNAENPGKILAGMTVAAATAVFFMSDKDLTDQLKRRKEALRLAYPDWVHRLALFLVAGLTIRGAFERLGKENELAGYAYREILSGQSESVAYEHFGKRAGVREYVKLSTLLCQNLKKGSANLMARLEEEALMASESRIRDGKILGEEAGTKLLIPMVMLLAVVMIMIMLPAFSVMGI